MSSCADCKFMDNGIKRRADGTVLSSSGKWTCHRYPPTISTRGEAGYGQPITQFPVVTEDDWCAEYLSTTARSKDDILRDFQ